MTRRWQVGGRWFNVHEMWAGKWQHRFWRKKNIVSLCAQLFSGDKVSLCSFSIEYTLHLNLSKRLFDISFLWLSIVFQYADSSEISETRHKDRSLVNDEVLRRPLGVAIFAKRPCFGHCYTTQQRKDGTNITDILYDSHPVLQKLQEKGHSRRFTIICFE